MRQSAPMTTRRANLALLALAALAVVSGAAVGCSGGSSDSSAASVSVGSPCGSVSPRSADYRYVVWIWMENRSYDEVIGSADAPYLTKLGRRCGIATNSHNITHPSLPNYIAATSGLGYRGLARFGSNCDPSGSCSTKARSIFQQAPSWKAYQESMPAPCTRRNAGLYAVRHNPPPYYRGLAGCRSRDVPFTELHGDLTQGKLPAFSFITPNLCNDTHDCPVAQGDGWLADHVPEILDSAAYRDRRLVLFISYDEGYGDATRHCASNQAASDCHIATVVVSPTTPARTRSAKPFNHYSLLRTTEEILSLPRLGKARSAPSMAVAFGLAP